MLKKMILPMIMLLLLIGCKAGNTESTLESKTNNQTDDNEVSTDATNTNESTNEEKGAIIRAVNEGGGFVIKSGQYLSVPTELPGNVLIPKGSNINSTTVGKAGSEAM